MSTRFLACCFLVLALPAAAQAPRVASLDWMSGTWVDESARGKVTESWVGPGNGMLVAANLSTFAGGKRSFEFLRIADTPEGFSYYASPGGRPAVEFKMKETGDRRVVFENPQHDFPQRILYWRDGDALVARVEGTINGKDRSEEWRFKRITGDRPLVPFKGTSVPAIGTSGLSPVHRRTPGASSASPRARSAR